MHEFQVGDIPAMEGGWHENPVVASVSVASSDSLAPGDDVYNHRLETVARGRYVIVQFDMGANNNMDCQTGFNGTCEDGCKFL